MNKYLYKSKKISILTVLVLLLPILGFSGCGIFKKDSEQSRSEGEQKEKAPKSLKEIETSIESIFQTLGAPAIGNDQESSEGQKESKDQEEQKDSKEQEESGNKEGEQKQDDKKPWEQISKTLDQLHTQWNDYLPEATNKNADSKTIDSFSDSLNTLTSIIEQQDKKKTLLAANALHSNIPELYSLYKTEHTMDIKRVVFFTRSCILYSQNEKWEEVGSSMKDLESTWTFLESALAKEQLDPISKLDLSIYELKKVVDEKDSQLINIKGRLALANIQELEKALEESE